MRTRALIAGAVLIAGCTSAIQHQSPPLAPTAALLSAPSNAGLTAPTQLAGAASTGATQHAAAASSTPLINWPTYHFGVDRAGVSATMPAPTGHAFVKSIKLNAAVYASPIIANGILIVPTELNSVYAFNGNGVFLWHHYLGAPARLSQLPCGNIDPSGITGTPVYSAGTGLVYVVTEHANPVVHQLVALRVKTGALAWARNISIPNTDPAAMQERGALTITGGRVWIPFGGRAGDCGRYKGTLIGYPLDSSTGAPVLYTVPTAREAGMWTPPGPSVDANGHIYVAVGNGASTSPPYDMSDSVLEFGRFANLISNFAPSSWAADNASDADLGSQGPALVGQWVYADGKSGTAYVTKRDALGGIGGQTSSASICHSFGGTAVSGNVVYVPCSDGVRAVQIDSAGHTSVLWHATSNIAGSPVVGGGKVWSLDAGAGVLYALNQSTGAVAERITVGATTRFATMAIYGPNLYVPTKAGVSIVVP